MPLMLVDIDVLIDDFGVRAARLGLSLDRVWAFPDHGDLSLPPEDGGFLTKVCCGPGDRSPCASAKWRESRRARLAAADLSHARANARTKSHRVGLLLPCPAAASRALHPPTVAIAMLCIYPRQRNAAPACSLNRSTRRT